MKGQKFSLVQKIMLPIVRSKNQAKEFRILSFGFTVTIDSIVPDSYKFQYAPDETLPDEMHIGIIPAGYSACIAIEDANIYFNTREGPHSPEYQICFPQVDSVLTDWTDDVDALWIETLQLLESANSPDSQKAGIGFTIPEAVLDFLDADPLFLFGVADATTQKAIDKQTAASVPTLKCVGNRPVLEEWFSYLNADAVIDKDFTWVIESFSESELPHPWTSYKGIGSIVCYLNTETNETTWKHPFYDYFSQLLEHCRHASREEHVKLRINRMLWSYENETSTDLVQQQPLISPKYVKIMADILGIDVVREGHLVRSIKTFLKAFALQYRLEEELDTQEVKWCLEIVENERNKHANSKLPTDASEKIKASEHGQVYCVECGVAGGVFCPKCSDCFCVDCFDRLHSKGNRQRHKPNHLIPCGICKVYPAKLQCTYTFGCFCHECYENKHIKTLPRFLDLKPVKIDYTKDYQSKHFSGTSHSGAPAPKVAETPHDIVKGSVLSSAVVAAIKDPTQTTSVNPPASERSSMFGNLGPRNRILAPGEVDPRMELAASASRSAPVQTLIGEKWHAFFDMRGVKYFYNFETQESMRRPENLADDWDAIVDELGLQKTMGIDDVKKKYELQKLATSRVPRMLGPAMIRKEQILALEQSIAREKETHKGRILE